MLQTFVVSMEALTAEPPPIHVADVAVQVLVFGGHLQWGVHGLEGQVQEDGVPMTGTSSNHFRRFPAENSLR